MSDGKKYYCFCGSNCKYETMTKEQIIAAIAQAATTGFVFDTEAAFITKVKESNAGGFVTFWVGTTAQYNALTKKDPNCIYIKTDDTEKAELSALLKSMKESIPPVDKKLAVSGAAADALVTGGRIRGLEATKLPKGLFSHHIGVNKNEGSQTFWQQIEAIYAGMAAQSIEYVCGNVIYDYKETDANEPAGGVWAVEIYKSNDKYGYVSARKYNNGAFGDTAYFVRNLINGVWSDTYYPQGEINTAINKLGIESTEFAGCFYRTVNGVQEWINPPLKVGEEYATTERYSGSRVYVKHLWLAAQTNGMSRWAGVVASGNVRVIDCRGIYYNPMGGTERFPLPAFKVNGSELIHLAQIKTDYDTGTGYTKVYADVNTSAIGINSDDYRVEVKENEQWQKYF